MTAVTANGKSRIGEDNFLHANMIRNPLVRSDKNNFIVMQRPITSVYERFWQMVQTFRVR